LTFDSAALSAFLDILLDASRGCAEIRVLQASIDLRTNRVVPHDVFQSTIAVWGDDPAHLVHEAARIRGISAYITVNPVNPALKARADRLKKARATTRDEDIVCLSWLYLDYDVECPDGISSTDEELAAARARLEKVQADHPELVLSSIWGCSGNGCWMLIRLPDYPNDAEHRALVARVVDWFREEYSDEAVTIDEKCKNPSRSMPLVGTMKCKGESSPDRPHRLATIESPPDRSLTPLDLKAWAAIHVPAAPPEAQGANGQAHAPDAQQAGPRVAGDVEKRAIAYLATIEPAVSGQRGHDKTFGAACRVGPGFDLPEATTIRLIREHYNPRCEPPWSDKDLEHKVHDAYQKEKRRGWLLAAKSKRRKAGAATTAPAGTQHQRPEIEISTRRDLALEETLKALAGDGELFRRGTSLGMVAREENDTAKLPGGVELRHARGSLRFVPIAPTVLGCRLTKLASFFRWMPDKEGEPITIDCHPPDWLIGAISDHQYWPGVRHLLSIAECPYVRDDGSIVSPGFDAATGTLYRPSVTIPALPDRPTRKDVEAALQLLAELVIQFPFETGFDRDVWLADLLTCIQRPMIAGPVPGFVYNGNAAGVGKGLLIDLVGLLVHGVPVGTRIYPIDPAEAAKVKLALALAAVPIVHFDNLAEGGFYGGGVIDSALTSTVTSDRILGQSRDSGNVPLRPTWHASGNNISPVKDSGRRWLRSNLTTTLEKPYERDDIEEKHLRDSTLKRRGELLGAALTILKAHALAGRPTGTTDGKPWAPLGSFEDWDHVVRGAVQFATGNDCLHTQREGEKERPDRLNKAALLEGWLEVDPHGEGKTIEEVLDAVRDHPTCYPTLRNALLSLGRDGKLPSSEKLRYKLRGMKNTPINRLRFETCGENRNGTSLWRVVAC
jgi:hypothetical protein